MKCPFCSYKDSRVIDSRAVEEASSIRRRRECPKCGRRFTTYETYEEAPLIVVKKDNRREIFNKAKILSGLMKAVEKRPVSYQKVQEIADSIEREIRLEYDHEVQSTVIGELVMKYLEQTDQIAYVRFASVYRQFADVKNFMQEVERMMKKSDKGEKKESE